MNTTMSTAMKNRSAALSLAGLAFGLALPGAALAQSSRDALRIYMPQGEQSMQRPASLPEKDEIFIPTLSPEQTRSIAQKTRLFPLQSAGRNLIRHTEISDSKEKIFGGTKAAEGAYPFQTALFKVKRNKDGSASVVSQFCGGSLVASRWVLTAAHCFAKGERGKISSISDSREIGVMIGGTNLSGPGERILAKRVIVHPKYVPGTSVNDIALVELDRPVAEDAKVANTLLIGKNAEAEMLPVGGELIILGWGLTEQMKPSLDLLESRVNVVERNACNRALTAARLQDIEINKALNDIAFTFNMSPVARKALENNLAQYGGAVTPQMFCAAAPQDGKDTCNGDSGGPILRKLADGRLVQVGIVSFGVGECGLAALPGVYTRLSLYQDWLSQVVASPSPEKEGAKPPPKKINIRVQ